MQADVAVGWNAKYARYRLSPSAEIKKETEDFFVRKTADGLPIEALCLVLTVLADAEGKQKRSPYADELVRYLATHISVDEEMGTAHVPSFYDELTRHETFHSNYRAGTSQRALPLTTLASVSRRTTHTRHTNTHTHRTRRCDAAGGVGGGRPGEPDDQQAGQEPALDA